MDVGLPPNYHLPMDVVFVYIGTPVRIAEDASDWLVMAGVLRR